MTPQSIPDGAGPFGNPDGARSSFDVVEQGFVDFAGDRAYGALATRPADASVRVIVGSLGAGKTVYMRRLSAYQSSERSVYADHLQQSPPPTDTVVQASDWFGGSLTEKWKLIWGRAILRSLTTHLLGAPSLATEVPEEVAADIRERYVHLLGSFRRPRTVYSEVVDMVASHSSGNALDRYLKDARWSELEDDLGELLAAAPPVFFYLDALDETWTNAPSYWMRCQEGLFLQVMDLLRHPRFGGRLHVCIGVRDLVMSSIFRSEHGPRYRGEEHIRILEWDRAAIEFLLLQKVSRLDSEYLMCPRVQGNGLEAWLGTHWIYNEARGRDEALLDYLLRHTRLIPRDVITLGNALCELILREKREGRAEIRPALIRDVVSDCARGFGDSQIAQCAGEVVAGMMPRQAVSRGFAHAYLDNQEFVDHVADSLKAMIRRVGTDRLGPDIVGQLRNEGRTEFEQHIDVPSILWQARLLGFAPRPGQSTFYSLSSASSFSLPDGADEYLLHPCLLDSVQGLRSVGRDPVYPYSRTE